MGKVKDKSAFINMKHQQVYYVATLAIFLLSMSSAFAMPAMIESNGSSPQNRLLAAKAAAPAKKTAAPAKKAAKAPAKSVKGSKKAGPHKKLTKKQIARELKGLKAFLHK